MAESVVPNGFRNTEKENKKMAHNEDEFVSYVEFENEDGETLTLEVLDYFEYEDGLYAILANTEGCDEDSDEMEVCVLKVIETEDGQEFVEPDESLIPELQEIVERIFEEMDECGCDDDDCGCHDDDCGCGHHHHHEN